MGNYLSLAKLHTRDISCINVSSNCLFKSKIFNKIFYRYNRLGYSIISNVSCEILSAGVISNSNTANGFYDVRFNISGFAQCGTKFMLALEKRKFVYEFNFENKEPLSNLNLINFSVEDWSDINKLIVLPAETNRRAIIIIKDFIHENNVLFVVIITLILTVIIYSLFVCYYF